MKRKELLQKSSTVAAVVLAAALMDPGAVQASAGDAGAAVNAAQIQEQSAEAGSTETEEAAVQSAEEETSETEAKEEVSSESEAEQTEETAGEAEDAALAEEETAVSDSGTENETAAVSESEAVPEDTAETDNAETTAAAAGWTEDASGNTKYVKEDGYFAYNEILTINGRKYYFDWNCYLVKGERFSVADPDSDYSDFYEASADGSLLENCWDANKDYYYGADGKSLRNGAFSIDGAYYAFDAWGNKATSETLRVDAGNGDGTTILVVAKLDGKLYVNEWAEEYGSRYYCGENGAAYTGFQTIDGKQYFFNEETAVLYQDGVIKGNDGTCYISAENGEAVKAENNSWTEWYGKRYYVKDGAFLRECIAKIGNVFYGFGYSGALYEDTSFWMDEYDENGKYLGDHCYRAREDGTLYISAWYNDGYCMEYYQADGTRCDDGIYTIDGKSYYFRNGNVWVNQAIEADDGTCYIADQDGVLYQAEANGWTEFQGTYYYAENGKFVKGEIRKIGDFYYGFDYDGRRHTSEEFFSSESDGQGNWKTKRYYAKADGTLYVNEWREEPGYSYRCYYQADGTAVTDEIRTINGKQYYFDEYGRSYKNSSFSYQGKAYFSDETGALTEIKNDTWTIIEGKYYYAKDGKILTGCVEKIGSFYYGFDYDGSRKTDTEFSFWETDRWVYYRAGADGVLYTNGWYEDGDEKYYYGEDAKGYSGVHNIDGILYSFSCGQMQINRAVEDGENLYVAGSDGVLREAKNNEWTEVDGKYYYVRDGKFLRDGIEKIGDFYYYFETSGQRKEQCFLLFLDEETDRYVSCRIKEDGTLATGWYQWYGTKYYYGTNGIGYEGFQTVDGKLYYFSQGKCYCDTVETIDGINYIFDEDGTPTEAKNNAWNQLGEKYYYVKDGEFLKGCVEKIGDAYYGFDWEGIMYQDNSFSIWDSETGKSVSYRANADGKLVTGWYTNGSEEYYYGTDGKGYEGLQTVDGTQYYFQYAKKICNATVTVDGKNYVANSSGKLIEAKNNSWTEADGFFYYLKNGEFLENCVEKINGSWYGFNGDGRMYANERFDIYDSETGEYAYYRAKKDGKLYAESWYHDNWDSYYYGKDGKGYEGLQTVDGKQYYFESARAARNECIDENLNGKYYVAGDDGELIEAKNNTWTKVGDYSYYLKDNKFLKNCVANIGGSWYGFNWEGQRYENTTFDMWNEEKEAYFYYRADESGRLITGWYQAGDDWYYYGSDRIGYEGLQTVNGKQYYFSQGRMCCSQKVEADGKLYVADKNGTLVEAKNNTWTQVDGIYYYVQNGEFLSNTIAKIGNAYYGFDWQGHMYADNMFSIWKDEQDLYYRAKKDGTLYTNAWYQDDSDWYYYGADGKGAEGIQTVNGKQYYFRSGRMSVNKAVTVDGKSYLCKIDGTLEVMKNNAWTLYNNNYYYVKNNKVLTECIEKIGSSYYGFDGNGRMYNRTMFTLYGYDDNGNRMHKTYFAKDGGALYLNSWVKRSGIWYYAGADGSVVTGLVKIGGKQYYFSSDGELRANSVESINEKIYSSDKDGVLTEVTGNNVWKRIHGAWYYIQDHKLLKDGVYKIGSSYYGFRTDGTMKTDMMFYAYVTDENGKETGSYYLANQDGTLKKNTWAKWKGVWYYFGSNAAGVDGVQTIDGKKYFFRNGRMCTDYAVDADQKNYICRADGTIAELKNNDWTLVDGNYYYVKDGKVLKESTQKIGNALYAFDSNGVMMHNGFCSLNVGGENYMFYAKDNGALVVSDWKFNGTFWYYFDKNGRSVNGVQTISGKKYYFVNGMMQTSTYVYNGDARYAAKADGTLVTAKNNAWVKADNTWYYVKDGNFCENEIIQISGKYYGFDDEGKMVTEGLLNRESENGEEFLAYVTASGALCTSQWKYMQGYGMMYFGKDGNAYTEGVHAVNGVNYLFGWRGGLITSAAVEWNGKNYAADQDGKAYELKEKWNKVGRYWYYVKRGKLISNQLETIGSTVYYFDSEGRMVTSDRCDYVMDDFSSTYTTVVVDADGVVQKNRTYEFWDGTYMFEADGKGAEGFKTVNGIRRYFQSGKMLQSTSLQIGDTYYAAADNGAIKELSRNGWTKVDSTWYYVDNGNMVKNGRFKINGKTYVFDKSGRMMSKEAIEDTNQGTLGAAADGTMLKNSWAQNALIRNHGGYWTSYGWMYFDENGQAVEDVQTINGKKYYFYGGIMKTNSIEWLGDGSIMIADSNGVLRKANRNGWTKVDGIWYYAVNGIPVKDNLYQIGKAWYAFDYEGRMYTDCNFFMGGNAETAGTYHAKADGTLLKNGSWKGYDGEMYYFDADGKGYEGIHKVNGVSYWFEDGRLLKNAAVKDADGKLYIVDSKGSQKTMANNQWTKVDGYYYYAIDGEIVKNEVVLINGKYYGFDEDGRMYENTLFGINGKMYHAGKGGALTSGKYVSGKDTYYFDMHGIGYEGVHYLSGKRCVFEDGKLMS